MWTSGFYRCEHVCSYRRQELQTFLEENYGIALDNLRRVVTYLLKNVEHGIEHDVLIVLMEFACIRHS